MLRRFAALAILAFIAPASLAADVVRCRLVRIAEWPVRFERGLPLIDGAINGKKIAVLLDTGAYASILTKAAAERLGLTTRGNYESMVGFGGESEITTARLEELDIAGAVRTNMRVRVGGERPIGGVDFILGDDFFRNADIEFHYAENLVRFYQARDCMGTPLAYWDRSAKSLLMDDDSKIVFPIRVNGRAALALLDSGASTSVIHLNFAAKLGITPQSSGVVPGGCSRGLGAGEVRSWNARFDTVELAGAVMRDAHIPIADFIPEMARVNPEVILGTDFLRAHRVLVSRSQRKVYFTHESGPVFPARKSRDCP